VNGPTWESARFVKRADDAYAGRGAIGTGQSLAGGEDHLAAAADIESLPPPVHGEVMGARQRSALADFRSTSNLPSDAGVAFASSANSSFLRQDERTLHVSHRHAVEVGIWVPVVGRSLTAYPLPRELGRTNETLSADRSPFRRSNKLISRSAYIPVLAVLQ
jgi:hypothetical protein